jgi:hypothetical protein
MGEEIVSMLTVSDVHRSLEISLQLPPHVLKYVTAALLSRRSGVMTSMERHDCFQTRDLSK